MGGGEDLITYVLLAALYVENRRELSLGIILQLPPEFVAEYEHNACRERRDEKIV